MTSHGNRHDRVAVKICGMTRPEDAALAAALGASAIGLVFWPRSPRAVTMAEARRVIEALPPLITAVGVFVDQPVQEVVRTAETLRLGAVQLHGQEEVRDLEAIPCRVIKALGVDAYDASAWADQPAARVTILLDAVDAVKRGGTGKNVDWDAAARIARKRPIMLAGGLRPENVAEAIVSVRPYAVDVASGVEREPGVKDHDRMRRFMDTVRSMNETLGPWVPESLPPP